MRPVLTAFMEDLALPSADSGPVLSWALARLASRWASDSEGPSLAEAAEAKVEGG